MHSTLKPINAGAWAAVLLAAAALQPGIAAGSDYQVAAAVPAGKSDTGTADSFSGNISWYGPGFHGKRTASGAIFDMNKHTAAHRRLRFHTKVLVENPRNGKSCVVSINDRGPYVYSRVMDVSKGSARSLGSLSAGVIYADCLILDD